MTARPSVTVILPTLNEEAFIEECLESLTAQDYPEIVEILVVDGRSKDATRSLAEAADPKVRVLDNPKVTAAAAMNVGLAAARGEVIVRADSHTLYATDYVRRCVEVLEETGAQNVGGRMRPVGRTRFGRAVAAVTSSPFGVGPGRFHYAEERLDVDTVYLGAWRRSTLEEIGGYDSTGVHWAAEDDELNFRIRRAGGRVVLDPTIISWYVPRGTVKALARQYRTYGLAKTSTLVKHRALTSWRPLVPAAFVTGSLVALVLPVRWPLRIALPVVHLVASSAVAARLAREDGVDLGPAIVAIEVCHWSYGIGFLAGLGRIVTGRGFDERSSGSR